MSHPKGELIVEFRGMSALCVCVGSIMWSVAAYAGDENITIEYIHRVAMSQYEQLDNIKVRYRQTAEIGVATERFDNLYEGVSEHYMVVSGERRRREPRYLSGQGMVFTYVYDGQRYAKLTAARRDEGDPKDQATLVL
jgi:hypothetical protein